MHKKDDGIVYDDGTLESLRESLCDTMNRLLISHTESDLVCVTELEVSSGGQHSRGDWRSASAWWWDKRLIYTVVFLLLGIYAAKVALVTSLASGSSLLLAVAFPLYFGVRFRWWSSKRGLCEAKARRANVRFWIARHDNMEAMHRTIECLGRDAYRWGCDRNTQQWYIEWMAPASDSEWAALVASEDHRRRGGGKNALATAIVGPLTTIVAPTSPLTVACISIMLCASIFLWDHWSGYSRPMDGVWRVSRAYFGAAGGGRFFV